MWIKLEGKETDLFNLLMKLPPDFSAAEKLLSEESFSSTEITKVALAYTDECLFDADDYVFENKLQHTSAVIENLHSTYIVDVIKFLLQYELDPNDIYIDDNIMNALKYIDNGHLAADALALLLEKGGKTDLVIPGECGDLFSSTDFDVWFDITDGRSKRRFDALTHYWMVLIGYGARYDEDYIEVFTESHNNKTFNLRMLRNHRDYSFGVTHIGDKNAISIFDKSTLWEVARVVF